MLRRSCFRSEKQHSLRSIFHGVYPEKAINNGVWQMCSELVVLVRMCPLLLQGRIQPVRWGGTISVIVGSQVSLRAHYCKRDEAYFTTLRCDKTMVGKMTLWRQCFFRNCTKLWRVTFVGFRAGGGGAISLDPPLYCCVLRSAAPFFRELCRVFSSPVTIVHWSQENSRSPPLSLDTKLTLYTKANWPLQSNH